MSRVTKDTLSLDSIEQDVLQILNEKSDVISTWTIFRAISSNYQRVCYAYNILKEENLLPDLVRVKKCDKKSLEERMFGNFAFCELKQGHAAMKFYNRSIAYAETPAVLALAYGNRSAVFFENKLYKQCLIDIDYAFRNCYPESSSEKLRKRKVKAEKLLLQSKGIEDFYTPIPELSGAQNTFIECASNMIEMKYSDKIGRHIIAKKKIEPGDVIAVEKPYVAVLSRDNYETHCYHCLSVSYNLIPCQECTSTLYCSEICRDSAWKHYHQYECCLMDTLKKIKGFKSPFLAFRIVLCSRNEFNALLNNEFKPMQPNEEIYQSARYNEIHDLMTNEEHRSVFDLFTCSLYAAIYFHLLKSTTFFNDGCLNYEGMKKCTFELMLKHLQTTSTNMYPILELEGNLGDVYNSKCIGGGVYAFMSLLNHSCLANVALSFYGTTGVLRALRPIEIGQQLLISYDGFHYATVTCYKERQQMLKKKYFFLCECDACKNDWPLYHISSVNTFKSELSIFEFHQLVTANRNMVYHLLPVVIDKLKVNRLRLTDDLIHEEIVKHCLDVIANKHTLF